MTANRMHNIASILVLIFLLSACWIPLPEDTAILIEVLDQKGEPVDGVQFNLDGTETLTTGTQSNPGQVFKNLSISGEHTLQLDPATLLDPQGGIGWTPLASQISGELMPLSFFSKPFAGGSNVLEVPVNKGEVTVVTIYLDDILKSPADNQWLTDGSDPDSDYRSQDNIDEFKNSSEPVFWWRQDPSMGTTVNHTFQLWVDHDGDTRYPLGIVNNSQYLADLAVTSPAYRQPDWQVPLAGIQRAEAVGVNEVAIWSGQAADLDSTPVVYDLHYAPTAQWVNSGWERNPVLPNLSYSYDGAVLKFNVGSGTSNSDIILKNGTEYTFALRARDADSNLDATEPTSIRRATPTGSSSDLGSVSNLNAFTDTSGGRIRLEYNCQESPSDLLRIYAAPYQDFSDRPYDVRFLRKTIQCDSSPGTYVLAGLVNGVTYIVGMEPFDAEGNIGTASSVIATPNSADPADTVPPSQPDITVSSPGPGQVTIEVSAVSDNAGTVSLIRRVYWAPASLTTNHEAMFFTDLGSTVPSSITRYDIPNNITYNYAVRAIDAAGNSSAAATQYTLSSVADTVGPAWATDDPNFFNTVVYSTVDTAWPLGCTWKYNGFPLGRDPDEGEYVWRIIQENPATNTSRGTKLGAFYTWPGYYYASTEYSPPVMSDVEENVRHRHIFGFIESGIESADVMGYPFDSGDPDGYRQRTTTFFSNALTSGSTTINQLVIFYDTDEDGQALVFPATIGNISGYAGILRVRAVNKQPPSPKLKPYLQNKEFRMSYFTGTGTLVTYPEPLYGGNIYYEGTLDDPDFMDPRW